MVPVSAPDESGGSVDDLIPMRTDFDTTLWGFDRAQVRRYIEAVEAEISMLVADRDSYAARADSLGRRLEESQSRHRELAARIDRICQSPIEPAALCERTSRMLELAERQAADTVARANAAAEHCWSAARDSAARLVEGYQRLAAELDERDRTLAAEQREIIDRARAEARRLVDQARRRGRELDAEDTARRRAVLVDFELAVHHRRAEVHAEVLARRARAERTARDLEDSAGESAERIIEEARARESSCLRAAGRRAEEIIAKAEETARAIELRARHRAERTGAEAEDQARRLIDSTRLGALRITRRAEDDARRLRAEADAECQARQTAAAAAISLALAAADQRLTEVAQQLDRLAELRTVTAGRIHETRSELADARAILIGPPGEPIPQPRKADPLAIESPTA